MSVFGSSFATGSIRHGGVSPAGRFAHDQSKAGTAPVQVVTGDDARALLADPDFRRGWIDLVQGCPWSTPWQSLDHADVWYAVYGDVYEPVLVVHEKDPGTLAGLLPLARHRDTGTLTHVGAHQAEYQVWLAREPDGNAFILWAMQALASRYPGQRLRFQYLPPNAPLAWCGTRRWGAPRTILRQRRRPLLTLGPTSRIEESLRKKSNKSRINRLRRMGTVALRQLTTSEELAPLLKTVSGFCDLRQGAMNATMPFHDDPRKSDLWLQLLDRPGLAHASVLMVGGEIAAAHIGLMDGNTVSLGIIAHSPFLAEHSPGKVLMMLLSQELGRQGFTTFDLTPDGEYKDRFADRSDLVHTVTVYFDTLGYAVAAVKNRLRTIGARTLGAHLRTSIKREWQQLRRRLRRWPGPARSSPFLRLGKSPNAFFTLPASAAMAIGSTGDLRVNWIDDLLLYRCTSRRNRQLFLSHALRRIEAGDRVYTLSRGDALLHCAWISNLTSLDGLDCPPGIEPSRSMHLLWDDFTVGIADSDELLRSSLRQRLHDAALLPGADTLLIRTPEGSRLSELAPDPAAFTPWRAAR